ncbi:antibiotic biosynthesis monooxygenase family protein [Leeuwenhoekiella polynyae]|uniref:Heme-degrading monooxygenase HmoA n=1 Tax=Leeuwenhoekiella polynyae TaxID=1550906 RepID=A0A4Q0PHR5_9FLAO|nr:antibiotic biosynthesis monooxygenase [Leeuwenhoekiella polynyae]RXG25799.1 heme-degrading monooxygenase HmoA [Leeuwenhoekiella polynyae]
MVKELAILNVIAGQEKQFETDFKRAEKYISSSEGYINHTLSKCLEQPNKYALLVNWETLESHIVGFRQSPEYLEWKNLLHHYYDPFPTVEHYVTIL